MGKNKKLMFSEEEQMLLFDEYQKTQDVEVRNLIVEANLGLVTNVVLNYFKESPFEFDDLIQTGVFGLVQAVEHFDKTRGFKFSTFATTSIKNTLANAHKRNVPDNTLLSIDEPITFYSDEQQTGVTLSDFLIDESESNIAKDLEMSNLLERVHSWVLANCDAREIVIFESSFGLNGLEPQTGEKLAEALNISTQRVFEIRQRLRQRLKHVFSKDLDFVKGM